MMNTLRKFALLAPAMVAAMVVPFAYGEVVNITFDAPNQTGNPGQTLKFFGEITNPGTDTAAVFLNIDSFNLALDSGDYTLTDDFNNTPTSLGAGETSGPIELFEITLSELFPGNFGVASGTYGLVGGEDGGDNSGSDVLGEQSFSIDVESATPEPATWMLLAIGMGAIWRVGNRRQTA
jgi:hypothetical protein